MLDSSEDESEDIIENKVLTNQKKKEESIGKQFCDKEVQTAIKEPQKTILHSVSIQCHPILKNVSTQTDKELGSASTDSSTGCCASGECGFLKIIENSSCNAFKTFFEAMMKQNNGNKDDVNGVSSRAEAIEKPPTQESQRKTRGNKTKSIVIEPEDPEEEPKKKDPIVRRSPRTRSLVEPVNLEEVPKNADSKARRSKSRRTDVETGEPEGKKRRKEKKN